MDSTADIGRLEQIRAIADRVARSRGLEVFDVQFRREAHGWMLRIYLDNSASDYGSTGAQTLSDILTKRGIEHQHVVNQNGEHDMEYWSEHVGEYLAFYGATWPLDASALPSCLAPSP